MQHISHVVALGHNNVIGKDNGLLWHLPDDLKHFKQITNGHPVIMGRKTWESLPEKFRPLPGRTNIVITRDVTYEAPGAIIAHTIPEAFHFAKEHAGADEICVIGGGEIYRATLPFTTRLYLTLVDDPTPGTVTYPDYSEFKKEVARKDHAENGITYTWLTLER